LVGEGISDRVLYSMALREAKSKWANGTTDDPPVLFRDVPPPVLNWRWMGNNSTAIQYFPLFPPMIDFILN
jgi:hypothetical protein